MNTEQKPKRLTREQFDAQAMGLGAEIVNLLKDRGLSSMVILEALLRVHRYVATQLPPDAQGDVSMALGAYAGDLLQASAISRRASAQEAAAQLAPSASIH